MNNFKMKMDFDHFLTTRVAFTTRITICHLSWMHRTSAVAEEIRKSKNQDKKKAHKIKQELDMKGPTRKDAKGQSERIRARLRGSVSD